MATCHFIKKQKKKKKKKVQKLHSSEVYSHNELMNIKNTWLIRIPINTNNYNYLNKE